MNINIPDSMGLGLALASFALAVPLLMWSVNWDGHLFPQENCWKIQEVNGQVFKLNTCTGEVKEIKVATATNTNSTKPE